MRNRVSSIIEGLHVNESVNSKLLDRFILYCKGANVENINVTEFGNKYFVCGISDKRFKDLADRFARKNKLIFDYDIRDGSTEVTRLETDYGRK